jgi:hypothetical protein
MFRSPCYKSRGSNCIGGIFITADGNSRIIPDHYLNSAKLQGDSTLLRLSYSSCVVDIYGYRLDSVYNDVVIGKLGTVIVPNPADAKSDTAENITIVTSIVYVNMSPNAAIDLERKHA